MFSKLNRYNNWSLMVLRVILGAVFIYHGYPKLFGEGAIQGTAGFFDSLGIPIPVFSAVLVGIVEFFGGVMLVLGLFSRWVSIPIAVNMLVALFLVHLKNGFSIAAGGFEFVLVLFAMALVVLTHGSGALSVESLFAKKRRAK